MNDQPDRRCLLISLAAFDGAAGEPLAVGVARRLGGACEALLVGERSPPSETPSPFADILDLKTATWRAPDAAALAAAMSGLLARGAKRINQLAAREGVQAAVKVSGSSGAMAAVSKSGAADIIIIAQPSDPLARRSHPFTAIGAAAFGAASAVAYTPETTSRNGDCILALAAGPGDPAIRFAEDLGQSTGEAVQILILAKTDDLAASIKTVTQNKSISAVTTTRGAFISDSSALAQLVQRLGTAVIVIEPEPADR